ncbi:MAG: M2 family metallopeptidase [Pirellulales bacterium]|nr:M2 family metallopeptidase [Pirellulales bacterium]
MRVVLVVVGLLAVAVTVQAGQPYNVLSDKSELKAMITLNGQAEAFLEDYLAKLAKLEYAVTTASWDASCSGKAEDFDRQAAASLALRKFHSDPKPLAQIEAFLKEKDKLKPTTTRALEVARLSYLANQLPADLLEAMVKLSSKIEKTLNTYRATVDGKQYTNNDLLEMIRKETDSAKRKKYWEALKQVGGQVGPDLIKLAKLRNQAAVKLGFANYWDMKIRLQEHDPKQLLAIFADLEKLTDEPFRKMKKEMDSELSRRFGVAPEKMMPWHYDDPFFQAAPPSEEVNLDTFYENKKKEEIVEIARRFYNDIGLPIDGIIARSDLYEREGKDQHAFCTNIDRKGDVRTLCNIKPDATWMDTMLHESGHAVYDEDINPNLPFNLREPAHIFTTEGIAMLFGALAKEPNWMIHYAGASPEEVEKQKAAILDQRRREQLIFARWTLVMLYFEKDLYENPDRKDLNPLWWSYVERFQLVARPPQRDEPDWAAKPHFTCAPVYYHNYMLGELFAAQLRRTLADQVGHQGPTSTLSFVNQKKFGQFLMEKVFKPGSEKPWPEFVRDVTGEPLSPKCFAEEVRQ